tara:strand:- start:348 stop:995 length:648 start_codon:yes stop_codon:yes gene_type:complete
MGKLRGYQNLWKDIEEWISEYQQMDLEYLEYRQRDWVKIYIWPDSHISSSNQVIEPKGKARRLITEGLISIYNARKEQLDSLGKPYYLKIWLHDRRFSESQVVCAIDDMIDFYEVTHAKPEEPLAIENSGISDIPQKYPEFEWEHRFDEELIDFNKLGSPDDYYEYKDYLEEKRWYTKMAKNKHRKIADTRIPEIDYRAFKKGNLWLGQKKQLNA